MKKAVLVDKMRIEVRDVPKPHPKDDEVLIKVHACSICGTDLHTYRCGEKELSKRLPYDYSLRSFYGAINRDGGGHQVAGKIVELGTNVTKWNIGDRVAGTCRHGFAEYCLMRRIYRLPLNISYDEGSYIEPLGVGVAAVRRSKLQLGDRAIILGAGPIGQIILQCSKAAGATTYVTEISKMRIKIAKQFADEVINPLEIDPVKHFYELTNGIAPNVIFECAGQDATIRQLIDMAGNYLMSYNLRVKCVLVALFENPWAYNLFDNNAIIAKNIELIGSMMYYPFKHPHDELQIALDLLKRKQIIITPLIRTNVSLNDINEGFQTLIQGKELGVIVKP